MTEEQLKDQLLDQAYTIAGDELMTFYGHCWEWFGIRLPEHATIEQLQNEILPKLGGLLHGK